MTQTTIGKVASNIYRTPTGWRVYVRTPDPLTGKSKLAPKRFPDDGRPEPEQLEDLKHFRDAAKLAAKRLRRQDRQVRHTPTAPTFAQDAAAYLALAIVQAMPSLKTRQIEIAKWVELFGPRRRQGITTKEIDEQLQRLRNEGYSGSTVNKFRTALMSLWTRLDGRGAANPVKDTQMFDEADMGARGQSYDLLTRILDAVPAKARLSRARLEVLSWTGMEPKQLGRMTPAHLSIAERWYVTPQRAKGSRRRKTPRPVIRKPMSAETACAFQRFLDAEAWGTFSPQSLRKTLMRATARVQQTLRQEYNDPTFTLPHIRIKDLRHSFGTELYRQTQNECTVAMMLDHASGSPMTRRYTLGGVPSVLRTQMDRFRGRGTA